MAWMALVCVEELDTRSRVHFSTSWDQFHSYDSTHTCRSPFLGALYAMRGQAIEIDRATAIATAAAPLPLLHMYVNSSPRTQGSSHQAS